MSPSTCNFHSALDPPLVFIWALIFNHLRIKSPGSYCSHLPSETFALIFTHLWLMLFYSLWYSLKLCFFLIWDHFFHTGSGLMPIGIFGIEYCICICISQSVLDKDLPRLIAKITPCVWNVLYNTNILPRLTTWTLGRASDFVDFFSPIHIFSQILVTCACLMCSLSIQAL